jgi:hypothetical protein
MRIVYAPVEGEFDPVIGPIEQHISTPLHLGMPMILPFVPAEVPDDLAEYYLMKPGWHLAPEGSDG